MQAAVIEFARNVAGLKRANSSEFDVNTTAPVIYLMEQWVDREKVVQKRDIHSDKGGTMRLGAYPCKLVERSVALRAYNRKMIWERHRHRYEFNNEYKEMLTKSGLKVSGLYPDGDLVEVIELGDHPWFLGCQFHPEFKSHPMDPHPLFRDFIKASLGNQGGDSSGKRQRGRTVSRKKG